MGTAAGMLTIARTSLGMGEPNVIQAWYRGRNGSAYSGNFSWCDAAVSYWARHSDNGDAVLPNGDRAYTVYHAQDFQKLGRWYPGTVAELDNAKPGDIVFFDWGQSNNISAIDHVGIIEKVLGGGRVQTIEGNTSDQCLRRVRGAADIAGYGRPAYDKAPTSPPPAGATWTEGIVNQLPTLKKGSTGEHVESLQGLLVARSHPEIVVDGAFGAKTDQAVRAVQQWGGITVDGVVGKDTWAVALRVH